MGGHEGCQGRDVLNFPLLEGNADGGNSGSWVLGVEM